MKTNFTNLFIALGICTSALAQTVVTGPSSSDSPYLLPVTPGYTSTSILTCTQSIGAFTLAGILDGAGAYDNNDGTFTFLVNHEIGNTLGSVRAHGSTGAFISSLRINKTTLAVASGTDLIQNVRLWNPSSSTYSLYNATSPSTLAAFGRFCSGDLPAVSAFYNSATGRGTQERIFMNGEETGAEGRAFAHIATGPNAGNTYELPLLGKYSWENSVASPFRQDKTIVIGMDDATPGQVYVYVGNKSTSGTEVDRAGLTNGLMYGVAVSGMVLETNTFVPSPNTTFSLININASLNMLTATGASLNSVSNNLGVTNFLRPEDGAWDPSRPSDFYFVTTNGFPTSGPVPSRMWRLRFTDIENPQLGGTITAVLDGTEGQIMMDNICIDHSNHIIIQEDPGNQAYVARMYEYSIDTDVLLPILAHDPNRFVSGAPNFLTQDEEASGVFDAQEILGPGMFLYVDQTHYSIPAPVVEGGQILALRSLNTATSNPEINIQGNAVSIVKGNSVTSTTNNTDFGMINLSTSVNKTFVIQNTGTGILTITGMNFTGSNAGDFSFISPPAYPATVAPGASFTITARYLPVLLGNSSATLNVYNNDYSEDIYDFAVKGTAVAPEIDVNGNSNSIQLGSTNVATSNNTDFGSVFVYNTVSKTFAIQNTGNGTLTINSMVISGANASDFTFVNAPTTPLTLNANSTQTFEVKYTAGAVAATSNAKITITNNDANEGIYDFAIQAKSMIDVSVGALVKQSDFVKVYPNPAKDEALVLLNLNNAQHVVISIFDITGKKVGSIEKNVEKGEQSISLNTSTLSNGEYFVKVAAQNQNQTIKLVVMH
jgi:hypothetical protein